MPQPDPSQSRSAPECTCRWTEGGVGFDPACVYHGDDGTMVVTVPRWIWDASARARRQKKGEGGGRVMEGRMIGANLKPSLLAKIADALRYNDECGPGPLSDDEYMDDARALLRIVDEHKPKVPVVPCDDAAVERGAEALVKIAARWGLGEWQMDGARELVREAFRAAGETP